MDIESHVLEQFNKDISKKPFKSISVALIGLGPHAKRIYLNYFKKHKIDLSLVVDLDSQRKSVKTYLNEQGFKNTKVFTINDMLKDNVTLSQTLSDNLLAVCNTMEITHIIIATEPKAHNMYLEFALKNNIHVLTDKPIVVSKNMTSLASINKVRNQYYNILKLSESSMAMCKVMCQRQYHKGYEYIKDLLNSVVTKYKVPITYIDIYHSDGNWEMAHDLEKENHPYKYGYGKLFHSGYHFIDLLSDFIKINNKLTGTKKITKGSLYSNCFTPTDELNIFNIADYKRIFKDQNIPKYYYDETDPEFKKYGEKNFYGLMKFTNNYNQTITNVNLNLLHYGFTRRGWIESRDFYKNNGRIRHERINIHVGTLLNIQIHSYQSKEIKERKDNLTEEQIGGLEHFDIDIYRNSDIIGGEPFERITLGSLYSTKEKKDILGYNELSRDVYLDNFFKGKCEKGDIKDQALAIEILYSCALGIRNRYRNKECIEKINVKNDFIYPVKINELKKYSLRNSMEDDKDIIKIYQNNNEKYIFSVILNKNNTKSAYETYLCIEDDNKIANMLLHKEFSNKFLVLIYFYYLKRVAKSSNISKITKLLGI